MFSTVQTVEPNTPLVNKSLALANGLVAAYYGTDYNAVTGRRLTRNGTMDRKQSAKGKGLTNWGTTSYLDDTSIPYVPPPFTLVSIVGSNTNGVIIFGFGGQASGYGWVVVAASPATTTNGLRLTYGNIADYIFPGQYLNTANRPEVIGVRADKTTATAFMNGMKKDTVSVGTTSSNLPQNARIGAIYDGASISGTPGADGFIGLTLLWNRALTDDEMRSITANPWQIFKSNPKINDALSKQIPAPNPTYRRQYAIGYENSSPSTEFTFSTNTGISGKYSGYSFNTSWSNSWSSPSSTVLTVSPNTGDFVFLTIIGNNTNATTVVDNAGSVWTNILNADSDGSFAYSFWYCNNIKSGATSITATFSGGYPTLVKMVAASYLNMGGTVLKNYAPRLSQINPGTSTNAIRSNTSFNNISSNTTGFTVDTNAAMFIGVTHQLAGGSTTYTSGNNFKLRRNYYGILHQDAEFNNIANAATVITCSETGGASNTYSTYGFAFDQPVIQNNLFYTAKAGDVLTTFRFRGRATFAAQSSNCVIGLRRVDTNEIIYTKNVTITYQSIHTLWEIPVAWHLTAGITYALFITALDNNTIVSYDVVATYGESSGGTQSTVGSTWSDTQATFGQFSDNFRYIISGDVTNTYGIKYKNSGTFFPSSATAVSPSIKVQKGDLILIRAVWAGGSPGTITIVDNAGQFYNSEYNTGLGTNGVNQESSVPHEHYAWDTTALISSDNFQFTITNSNSLTPYLIQYAIYSSPFPFFIQNAYRGINYGIGGIGNAEAYTFLSERPFIMAVMADSGNTTPTSGDYLYPQATATYATNRASAVGVNGVTPATLIYDINGTFAANGSAEYGSSGVYTSLGASNGKTAAFSRHWQFFSGPSNYRQAAARADSGTITFATPTKPRSIVMVFVQSVGNDITVSDNKNTVYKSVNVCTDTGGGSYAVQRFFYGYPEEGMTQITVVGGNSTSYAVEEPEMQVVAISSATGPLDYIATKQTEAQYFPYTWSANTSTPDVGYVFLGQTAGLARPGVKSIGDTLWAPVAGTGIDPVTGEKINESYGASTQLLRAELSQSGNVVATLSSLPEVANASEKRFMVFLKKPQLMLGPDVTKWIMPWYPTGYVTGPGITCTWYRYGYQARFSGYTTAMKYVGTGGANSPIIAIYDSDGVYMGKSYGTASNTGGVVSLPINVYLEKGKTYYIAFMTNENYFSMYGNYNNTSYKMNSYGPTEWAYSATTPPANIVGTTGTGVGEVAMWIDGIPSTIKQYSSGILNSGQLIETY